MFVASTFLNEINSLDAFSCSKVTVKTFIILERIYWKGMLFFWKNQRIQKKIVLWFPKNIYIKYDNYIQHW